MGLVSDAPSTQQTICPILQYMQGWTASVSIAAQDKKTWAPLFSRQFTTSLWRANTCTLKVAFIFVLAKNLKATSELNHLQFSRKYFYEKLLEVMNANLTFYPLVLSSTTFLKFLLMESLSAGSSLSGILIQPSRCIMDVLRDRQRIELIFHRYRAPPPLCSVKDATIC